ncbi:hypothetical protein K402DRAFT_441403, partial [Aulographum hederae CBS 113979]
PCASDYTAFLVRPQHPSSLQSPHCCLSLLASVSFPCPVQCSLSVSSLLSWVAVDITDDEIVRSSQPSATIEYSNLLFQIGRQSFPRQPSSQSLLCVSESLRSSRVVAANTMSIA